MLARTDLGTLSFGCQDRAKRDTCMASFIGWQTGSHPQHPLCHSPTIHGERQIVSSQLLVLLKVTMWLYSGLWEDFLPSFPPSLLLSLLCFFILNQFIRSLGQFKVFDFLIKGGIPLVTSLFSSSYPECQCNVWNTSTHIKTIKLDYMGTKTQHSEGGRKDRKNLCP
jgi:hypothetical protein